MRNIASALRDIDYPDIDYGGCGIASLAAVRLAKKHGEDVDIVFLYKDFEVGKYEDNQSLLRDGNVKDMEVPSHVAITFDGVLVDPHGDVRTREYRYTQTGITELELVTLIHHGNWNENFQKHTYIPMIEKSMGVDLSDIKDKEIIL